MTFVQLAEATDDLLLILETKIPWYKKLALAASLAGSMASSSMASPHRVSPAFATQPTSKVSYESPESAVSPEAEKGMRTQRRWELERGDLSSYLHGARRENKLIFAEDRTVRIDGIVFNNAVELFRRSLKTNARAWREMNITGDALDNVGGPKDENGRVTLSLDEFERLDYVMRALEQIKPIARPSRIG